MSDNFYEKDATASFSLRKIPVAKQNNLEIAKEDDRYLDKIKILELSNSIDEWEKELLFSEGGYFSLKGKEVENKSTEYINELEKFINSKIFGIKFSSVKSKEAANEIKNLKIENIKQKMLNYEISELFEWEIDVYNKTVELSIEKALLYKNNPDIVSQCLQNGLSALKFMSQKEKWGTKIFKAKKDNYVSKFYYSLIMSFLDEKDITFLSYYEKYKSLLDENKQNELEEIVLKMKNNIIAYNWAKELFSYNLSDSENEVQIKKLCNKELETQVRIYFSIMKKNKKRNEKTETEKNTDANWNEIISLLNSEPDKAYLYIDLSAENRIIKSQKDYIKKISENGYIETDESEYVEILKEMIENPQKFQTKQLNVYKHILSEDDFNFLSKLQKDSGLLMQNVFDFKFIIKKLEKQKLSSPSQIYNFIKLYNHSISQCQQANSGNPDIEKRNKIIEAVLARNIEKE